MGMLSKFEGGVESAFDKASGSVFKAPLEPAEIARRAEKQMKQERLVGANKQYAPTLYTVLVNSKDDCRLFAFYPTMAAEIETYLLTRGTDAGLSFDCRPLVRFIVDRKLRSGKFDVIAENVASAVILELREEEMLFYGLKSSKPHEDVEDDKLPATAPELQPDFDSEAEDDYQMDAEEAISVVMGAKHHSDDTAFAPPSFTPSLGYDHDELEVPDAPMPSPPAANQPVLLDSAAVPNNQLGHAPSLVSLPEEAVHPASLSGSAPSIVSLPDFLEGRSANAASQPPNTTNRIPSARALGSSYLIDTATGRVFALTSTEMGLGRSSDNAIVVNDANASRYHALLRQGMSGKWQLSDLGSTNGTMLNGRFLEQAILRNHDQITIGTTNLEFETE
ncbi:MAG: DUF3662 domain-containing protein [Actinomycetia bacterium]|nr:DUF3662 domain-containing protein [Actinomycetes bacterium]